MQSIIGALTWEYVARNRWLLLAPILANIPASCMILLPLRGIGSMHSSRELISIYIGIQIVLFLSVVLIAGFGVLATQGRDLKQLYLMPISTIRLATFYYLSGALLVALQVGLLLYAWRSLFAIDWPITVPVLFAVVCWCAFQPIFRGAMHSLWWIVAAVFILVALIQWLLYAHGIPERSGMISSGIHLWSTMSALDILIGTAVVCISFPLTIWRVACDRSEHRKISFFERVDQACEHLQSRWTVESKKLHSPIHALGWFDYRAHMFSLPAGILVGLLLVWIVAILAGIITSNANLLIAIALGGTNLFAISQVLLAFALILNSFGLTNTRQLVSKSFLFESAQFIDTLPISALDKGTAKLRSSSVACAIPSFALLVSFLVVAAVAGLLDVDLKNIVDLKVNFWKYITFVCSGVFLASFAFSNLPSSITTLMFRVDLWLYPIVVMAILLAFGTPIATSLTVGLGVLVLVALVYATIQSLSDEDVTYRKAICIWLTGLALALGSLGLFRNEWQPSGSVLLMSLVGLTMLPFFTTADSLRRARTT
jgi:hypothetical protein